MRRYSRRLLLLRGQFRLLQRPYAAHNYSQRLFHRHRHRQRLQSLVPRSRERRLRLNLQDLRHILRVWYAFFPFRQFSTSSPIGTPANSNPLLEQTSSNGTPPSCQTAADSGPTPTTASQSPPPRQPARRPCPACRAGRGRLSRAPRQTAPASGSSHATTLVRASFQPLASR